MVIQSSKLKRADSSDSECDDLLDDHSRSPVHGSRVDRKKRRGIIEKRRRDRINNSLIELKRLVPSAYEKQGSAKLEKAEILQMTVDHLKTVQHKGYGYQDTSNLAMDYRSIGFRECAAEVARYLVSVEGLDMHDPLRVRLLSHLQYYSHQRDAEAKTRSLCSGANIQAAATVQPAYGSGNPWSSPPTAAVVPLSTGLPCGYPSQSSASGGGAFHTTSPADSLFTGGQPGYSQHMGSAGGNPGITSSPAGGGGSSGEGSGGGGFLSSSFRLTSAAAAAAAAANNGSPLNSNPVGGMSLPHPSMPCSGLLPTHAAFSSMGIGGGSAGGMTTTGYPPHPHHQTGPASALFQSSHHMGMKPYRPWGTELGAY